MIYVTGDTHGRRGVGKLLNFTKALSKEDYVIIAGDFGFVWSGSKDEQVWLKILEESPYTVLFVDGNHDNHPLINSYPKKIWCGGEVHQISDTVYHLARGQVFTIDNHKLFVMGGGTSIDRASRIEGISWWATEIPSEEEYDLARRNLLKHNNQVDYIITHTTSNRMMHQFNYIKEKSSLNDFLDEIEMTVQFKHWYFGHFHEDATIDEKHTIVYLDIVQLGDLIE